MKLREEEFYEQYHQHGGTTIIPTEIFNELYDDATEEIERLNNIIKHTDSWIDRIIEIIKQQPSEDDTWILERLNGIKQCLKEENKRT